MKWSKEAHEAVSKVPFFVRQRVRRRVEEDKVAIRNVRHDAMNKLKDMEKNKEISQDDDKRAQNQLQKLTDAQIIEAEQTGRNKEAEITRI